MAARWRDERRDYGVSLRKIAEIKSLTGIRGVAAWWVVFFHFRDALPPPTPAALRGFVAAGYVAVDLFFILSGFVITLNYGERLAGGGWQAARSFLAARLARIYPLHLAVLLLFILNPIAIRLWGTHSQTGNVYSAGYFWLSLLLMQNWGFTRTLDWNVPAWSISAEWLVYILFPFIVTPFLRLSSGRVQSASLCVGLLAGLAIISGLLGTSLGGEIIRFGTLRCGLEFMIGATLCRAYRYGGVGTATLANGVAALGLSALVLGYTSGWRDYLYFPGGFACLILSLTVPQSQLARALSQPTLVWLGQISYSTYLTHYLIKDWLKFAIVVPGDYNPFILPLYVALVGVLSVILYHLVEMPGRKFVRRALDCQFGGHRPGGAAPTIP